LEFSIPYFQHKDGYIITQNRHTQKLKPGLVTPYDIWPENEVGLFW